MSSREIGARRRDRERVQGESRAQKGSFGETRQDRDETGRSWRGHDFGRSAMMRDPRTGERVGVRRVGRYEGSGDYRTRDERESEIASRFTGRGYHYPGGARYPYAERAERQRAIEARERWSGRSGGFDEEFRDWDPGNRDEFWRHGEYGSRLYGGVVGAATPSGTAGIERYRPDGSERVGPKGYTRSDERLHDDICERLSDEIWLDLSEVEVRVDQGNVTLDGYVADRYSKYAIEDIADGCWGVKEVENRLRIRPA